MTALRTIYGFPVVKELNLVAVQTPPLSRTGVTQSKMKKKSLFAQQFADKTLDFFGIDIDPLTVVGKDSRSRKEDMGLTSHGMENNQALGMECVHDGAMKSEICMKEDDENDGCESSPSVLCDWCVCMCVVCTCMRVVCVRCVHACVWVCICVCGVCVCVCGVYMHVCGVWVVCACLHGSVCVYVCMVCAWWCVCMICMCGVWHVCLMCACMCVCSVGMCVCMVCVVCGMCACMCGVFDVCMHVCVWCGHVCVCLVCVCTYACMYVHSEHDMSSCMLLLIFLGSSPAWFWRRDPGLRGK